MIGFKVCCVTFSRHRCVFFIFLCHACDIDITIYLDTGIGKKRLLINVSEKAKMFGKEWCKILLRVYVFTGEGFVSDFNGKCKVTHLKKLMKYPKLHSAFSKLVEERIVPKDVTNYLKEFLCVIYGYIQETTVNAVITKMLKKMVGEDEGLTSRSKVD